jgi:DNA mismatch repair protein MutS
MIDCSEKNSIILADELCSGTEINSALSLVSATVLHLARNNCKFIFTTHYHQLVDIPQIKELSNVKPFHMKVDIQNGKLIFNRTLQPGKCIDNYGIEIAQFMKMPIEFIHLANTIRDNLNDNYIVGKPSRYNSDLFMTQCKVCSSRKDLHTHHIVFQSQMTTREKDYKNNLVVLCEECHQRVHKGELNIEKVIESY